VPNQPRLAVESIAGQRPYQEDSVLAETMADGRTLVAVADGMGGHAAGEVASALALETLTHAITEGKPLGDAFRLANQRVHDMASEPGKQGMGTTLVAVLVDGDQFSIANVGDSRAYLISTAGIRRLTEDHSFVAEAMKRGQTEEEAMATPWRDALTRSIGTDGEVEVDVFGPFPIEADSAFLICSDGLYKTLSDDELHGLFGTSTGARGAAQSLVTAAFDNGSDDNISVVIAEYGDVPRKAAPSTLVMEAFDPNAAPAESSVVTAGEGSLVGGLPVPALAAIVLVVGALIAALVFGG
jgi:protein phosphatase